MRTQDYAAYTPEDLQVWDLLFEQQMQRLPDRADQAFLQGVEAIGFRKGHIPDFREMDLVLTALTGWSLEVVDGLIDNRLFFELLRLKRFPASTWFRKLEQLDYLEEPDMFHDVFGHVPLLTNRDFCAYLQGLSDIALAHIEDPWIIELISRIYWYTVEFGLIRTPQGLRIYGAGILSSAGESVYCLESPLPQRLPFQVRDIARTPYIKEKFQEQYFVIEDYAQLYGSLPEIAHLMEQIAQGRSAWS